MRISDWSSDVCSSDLTGRALRFPGQGRVHPMRYLAGLARAVRRAGGRIHRDTAYVADRETAEGVEIETAAGHVIQETAAVFATNSPVNDRIAITTKQPQMRTYAIAGPVPARPAHEALLRDNTD